MRGKIHQEREFGLEPCVPGTEHIKGMSEIPAFVVAVPALACVRGGVVASIAVTESAGGGAGSGMAPIRGCM